MVNCVSTFEVFKKPNFVKHVINFRNTLIQLDNQFVSFV